MTATLTSVAVWSPKGGVGKSVIAVGLAMRLAERQRTVLIDGNPDNPDIASLLQCNGHPNVTGWEVPASTQELEALLVRHSNRLWVLPGPPRYVEEGSLTGPVMESIITSCTEAGMTVVIDLGAALRDSTVAALDRVDRVLIPVTLDLLSVAPLRRLGRELELLRLPAARFRVVINRHTNTREITADDISAFSTFPIEGLIPSAKEVAAAVNRGEVGVALVGDSPVGRALDKLAQPLFSASEAAASERKPRTGGLLGGLRRGES